MTARTNANIASASHDSRAPFSSVLPPLSRLRRHSYARRDFGLGPPAAAGKERERPNGRTSGGERSPINSR